MTAPQQRPRPRPIPLRLNAWLRWLHIYTSMFSLLVVLFFSLTGITLNHPDWTLGGQESRQTLEGKLPQNWLQNGRVDWLTVVEHLRATDKVRGRAEDMRQEPDQASVSFAAPGYRADAFIDSKTGNYKLSIAAQGWVAVMNDLHKGRDSGSQWSWLIDFSAGFLVLVSLTGLGLLVYLKKFRVSALLAMLAGAAIMLALMRLAGA